jgi:hypothetical protein
MGASAAGGLFAAGLAAGLAALAWKSGRVFLLGALLLLAGWANLGTAHGGGFARDLRLVLGGQPEDVKLRGVICAPPTPRIFERGAKEFWHTGTLLQAAEIWRGGHWQPAWGKVIAGTSGILASNFFDGRSVEVSGIIRPLRGPLAAGLFDPRRYYQRQEVYFQLQAGSTNAWLAHGAGGRAPLSDRFSAWARRTLALGMPEEDRGPAPDVDPGAGLEGAADGKRGRAVPAGGDVPHFRRGRTAHRIARGHRHRIVARAANAARRLRAAGRSGDLVLRGADGMAGLGGAGGDHDEHRHRRMGGQPARRFDQFAFRRRADYFGVGPATAFSGGVSTFVSHCACASGCWRCRCGGLSLARFFPPDPFVPDESCVRPGGYGCEALRRRGIDAFVMSLAAFLGGLPLAAYYFHLFTPVGVPANMVVVPLTALALMSCMASLLTGGWFPGLAVLFNHSAWFWMKCIIAASQWSARIGRRAIGMWPRRAR